MKYTYLIILLFSNILLAQNQEWGWEVHRYINEHAVDYLPAGMSFFQDHRSYLKQHSVDPDTDPLPGFYHYIDIDNYQAFFTGTLPHSYNTMVATYGLSTVENNGIVPWVVEWWTDSLTSLMSSGNWDDAWQVAAELGHYVADSHQPLHLTKNYNGYLTGNNGIHSRYETTMINPHLSQLPLPTGAGNYLPTVIDSVFLYIDEIYPYVDSIMIADDLAYAQDPNYGSTYYTILWQELEHLTTVSIHKSILDLASIWQTAWINAGSPSPYTKIETHQTVENHELVKAYPNPFNPNVTIQIQLDQPQEVEIQIFDVNGRKVATLFNGILDNGVHRFEWNALSYNSVNITSGTYFAQIKYGENIKAIKLLLIE